MNYIQKKRRICAVATEDEVCAKKKYIQRSEARFETINHQGSNLATVVTIPSSCQPTYLSGLLRVLLARRADAAGHATALAHAEAVGVVVVHIGVGASLAGLEEGRGGGGLLVGAERVPAASLAVIVGALVEDPEILVAARHDAGAVAGARYWEGEAVAVVPVSKGLRDELG